MLNRIRAAMLTGLPQHAISRLVFRLARWRTRWKNPLVRWFIAHYGVDMDEAAEPDPAAYATFNAFFTRGLRPGCRPLAGDADTLASPVDGRISQYGAVTDGRLLQAKGIDYSVAALLGTRQHAAAFDGGGFITLYLAPGDYHRIHMPLDGRLQSMIHVPGRLFSVATWTVETIPGLFTRNERVCVVFETRHGALALVLVGAINVGAIETVWAGLVTPPSPHRILQRDYPPDSAPRLPRGREMGRFNMGSTVIILLPREPRWGPGTAVGARARVGEALARVAE